jgi:hypothetical protein
MILAYDISGTERGRHGSEWAIRETFMAIVSSNLPLVYPLIKGWITTVTNSVGGRKEVGSVRISDHPWKGKNDVYGHKGFAYASTRSLDQTTEPPSKDIRVDMDIKVSRSTRRDTFFRQYLRF